MSIINVINFKNYLYKIILFILFIFVATQALAVQTLRIEVNKASILKLVSTPSTIIIGNPAIADVSVQDNNIVVLTGKSSGRTNIIILDDKGNTLYNYDLAVQEEQTNNLTMFNGSKQASFSCAPYCESIINANDDIEVFTNNLGAISARMAQVEGAASAAAAATGEFDFISAVSTPTGDEDDAPNETFQTFTILPPQN